MNPGNLFQINKYALKQKYKSTLAMIQERYVHYNPLYQSRKCFKPENPNQPIKDAANADM